MERMWSPWRSKYIETFSKKKKPGKSIFTLALRSKNDVKNLIVWRGEYCFVIMNRYPYNSGHLMVVPNRETAKFEDLDADEVVEIMQTARRAMRALTRVLHPHGFNFGANLGRASGAGIDTHVHFHVVPRWNGDTNFMPVLSGTKVISQDVKATLKKLRKVF